MLQIKAFTSSSASCETLTGFPWVFLIAGRPPSIFSYLRPPCTPLRYYITFLLATLKIQSRKKLHIKLNYFLVPIVLRILSL